MSLVASFSDEWGQSKGGPRIYTDGHGLDHRFNPAKPHQGEVSNEGNCEADEPGIIVEGSQRGDHQADERCPGSSDERKDRPPIEAARILVSAVAHVEVVEQQD